jgi:hypothetical protein
MSIVVLIFSLFGVSDPAATLQAATDQLEPTPTFETAEPMRWYGVERMLAEFEAEAEIEAMLPG